MRARIGLSLALAILALGCSGWSRAVPTSPGGPPVLTMIAPASGAVGDTVTLSGSGFTPTANAIKIGAGYLNGVGAADSTSLRVVLPSALTPCPPSTQVCVALALLLTPGTYPVSVVNANGTSNELSLQVVAK